MTPAQFLVRCSRDGIRIQEEAGTLLVMGADAVYPGAKCDRIDDYVRRHDIALRRLLGLTPRTERPAPVRDEDSFLTPDEFAELAALVQGADEQYALFEEASWNGLPRLSVRLTLPSGVYVDDPNPMVRGIQHRLVYAQQTGNIALYDSLTRDMTALTAAIKDTRSRKGAKPIHRTGSGPESGVTAVSYKTANLF